MAKKQHPVSAPEELTLENLAAKISKLQTEFDYLTQKFFHTDLEAFRADIKPAIVSGVEPEAEE